MFNFINYDSPAMHFMIKLKDLILLNLVWLLFCLPVVTIGPATTALYTVARKMAQGDWPKVWSTFTKEFRQCFRNSFLMSLCLLIPTGLLGLYLFMTISGTVRETLFLTILCGIASLVIGFVISYAYPLSAYFENTVGQTLKNAMLLSIMSPLRSLAVTVLNAIPVLLFLLLTGLFIRICIVWILIGVALTAFINCKILEPFFNRFILTE